MKPLLSEFSYGYALTEELATGVHGLVGAPVFPTQNQEGETGGYDVEIPFAGVPLFLQFKLSDFLRKRSAKEYSLFDKAYYRMHLRPRRFSKQHQLLIEWQEQGNEVYYVAPEFHTHGELNTHYLNNSVVEHSVFFAPSDIGALPDQHDHYVAYATSSNNAWFCSGKPAIIKKRISFGQFTQYFRGVLSRNKQILSDEFINAKSDQILSLLSKNEIDITSLRVESALFPRKTLRGESDSLRYLAYLSRTYLDSELLIIKEAGA